MPSKSRLRDGFVALGGATIGVLLVSIGWAVDRRSQTRRAAQLHRALVDLLLNTLSAGDPVTERHSRRVADLADALFDTFPFSRETHSTLRLAALLHDLGKVDDRFFHILHSYQALSKEDREQIEEHPHESADILQPLEPVHPGLSATVEAHHECWDGNGYPAGLAGREIPIGARIISVADVFDALTQPRSYHEPLSADGALREIRKGIGSRFDPEIVARLDDPRVRARWVEIVARGREEERSAANGKAPVSYRITDPNRSQRTAVRKRGKGRSTYGSIE